MIRGINNTSYHTTCASVVTQKRRSKQRKQNCKYHLFIVAFYCDGTCQDGVLAPWHAIAIDHVGCVIFTPRPCISRNIIRLQDSLTCDRVRRTAKHSTAKYPRCERAIKVNSHYMRLCIPRRTLWRYTNVVLLYYYYYYYNTRASHASRDQAH